VSHYLHGIDASNAKEVIADIDEILPPFSENDEDVQPPTAAMPQVQDDAAATVVPGSSLVPFTEAPEFDRRAPKTSSEVLPAILSSEIKGVSDEAWTEFVKALKVAEPSAVSAQGALGLFALKPKRLADLGLMVLSRGKPANGRHVVWQGEFVPPLTRDVFMATPRVQYKALVASMRRYLAALKDGTIPPPAGGVSKDMSLSGVLTILHKCGPSGLETWNDPTDRFPSTQALFEKTNGLF
jgi:hypothetical protein